MELRDVMFGSKNARFAWELNIYICKSTCFIVLTEVIFCVCRVSVLNKILDILNIAIFYLFIFYTKRETNIVKTRSGEYNLWISVKLFVIEST